MIIITGGIDHNHGEITDLFKHLQLEECINRRGYALTIKMKIAMLGDLNQEQIKNLLSSQMVGRLGCHADDKTYVVPVTYAYDKEYLYMHTQEGMKIDMMRKNPKVCFEVDHVDNMANWQSAVVWGTYEELNGKEAEHALQTLVNRVMPLVTSQTSRPRYSLDRPHAPVNPNMKTVVFRIKLTEATGRFEKSQ